MVLSHRAALLRSFLRKPSTAPGSISGPRAHRTKVENRQHFWRGPIGDTQTERGAADLSQAFFDLGWACAGPAVDPLKMRQALEERINLIEARASAVLDEALLAGDTWTRGRVARLVG